MVLCVSSSDAELDQMLTGSELLLSALLQNTVQGSGAPGNLTIASEGPYDFYHQPNMREACLCFSVLEQLSAALNQRLQDFPEHPALVQVSVFNHSAPGRIFVTDDYCESIGLMENRPLTNSNIRPVTVSPKQLSHL